MIPSIFSNLKQNKKFKEEDLITTHDFLMSEYGWIPLDELKTTKYKIPIEYEIPIVLHTSRGNWFKDLIYGKIEKVEMVKCNGQGTFTKEGFPIPTFFNLINKMNERYEKQKGKITRKITTSFKTNGCF